MDSQPQPNSSQNDAKGDIPKQDGDKQDQDKSADKKERVFNLYGFGSGDLDQLPINFRDPDFKETKIPLQINLKDEIKIKKIQCGWLHTVLLSSAGNVYTFGCNDDGALGRITKGDDDDYLHIEQVDLHGDKMTDVQAGEIHSICYNSNTLYYWGSYRVKLFLFIFNRIIQESLERNYLLLST
ncbi:MAG: hypothetical protein MJ252_29600 [archaeon]|nr:hypothetical protein [archaeon]